MRRQLLLLALALSLSACSLTPPLLTPGAPVPSVYPLANGEGTQANIADLDWRAMFPDLRLQRLIELALENNRDLRLAALNVQAVQAQYGIQRATQLPAIEATAGVTRQRGETRGTGSSVSTQHNLGWASVHLNSTFLVAHVHRATRHSRAT